VHLNATWNDNVSDVASVLISTDQSAWISYTDTFVLAGGDGTKTIYLKVKDAAGNTIIRDANIILDTVPPMTALTFNGETSNNYIYTSQVSCVLTTTGTVTFYRISIKFPQGILYERMEFPLEFHSNNTTWANYSTPIVIDVEGNYTVYYKSIDDAQNREEERNKTFIVDLHAPTTTINIMGEPFNGTYVNATIRLAAVDNVSGVKYTKYKFGSETIWTGYNAEINLTDGAHLITFFSVDNAGHYEDTKTTTIWVNSNANKPQVKNFTVIFDGGININLDAKDPMNGNISLSIFAIGPSGEIVVANNTIAGNITFDTENILNGEYTITIYVKNAYNQTVKVTNKTIVNNNAIRNMTFADSGSRNQIVYKGEAVPITVAMRNYENRTVTYRLELYDNDVFVSFGSKEITLKPLEASNMTIHYAPKHASIHSFTVKVVDAATSKVISEKSFITDVQIETGTPPMSYSTIFIYVFAAFILIIAGIVVFKLKKPKRTHKVKRKRKVRDEGKKEIEIEREIEVEKKEVGQSKCNICLGLIKPNLPVIVCRCGNTYHESCAERVEVCPQCGEKIAGEK
jgi:hypothetical protein